MLRHKPIFNRDFFNIIDSELKAYWLGFLYADGCVSRTHVDKVVIKLSSKDKNHLVKWHEALESNNPIGIYNDFSNNNREFAQSTHVSTIMCDNLEKLGCFPNKSLYLKFPTEQQVPFELLRHFIRGYFDGDGCISSHLNQQDREYARINFLGTKSFLQSLQQLFNTTYTLTKPSRVYSLEISKLSKIREILSYMYKESNISLSRKAGDALAHI